MSLLFRINFLDALIAVIVVKIFPDLEHQILINFHVASLAPEAVLELAVLVHVVHLAGNVVTHATLK